MAGRESAASLVTPEAYVSLEPVPLNRPFEVALVVKIADGYHMNSHKPLDAFLIPTDVSAELPRGFRDLGIDYPEGKLLTLAFSPDKPLSVYSGSVTLRLKLEAASGAALGTQTIPLTLHYQACSDSTCLPPVKVPVKVKLTVATASTQPRAVHPELFSGGSGKTSK